MISVIIPIYKVEAYLKRCIDSVLTQSYTDMEIILVDDESPDNCPAICEEYAKQDSRIRVIHKKNGGLSDARNAGLDIAKGDYISFVDSDDWVAPDFLESMYGALIRNNADISICGMVNHYEDGHEDTLYAPATSERPVEGDEIFDTLYQPCAQNKMYKASIFKSVRYPVGRWYEDVFAYNEILPQVKRIAYTGKNSYFYYIRNNSIMHTAYCLKSTHIIEACDARAEMLDKLQQAFHANEARLHVYSNLKQAMAKLPRNIQENKERLSFLKSIYLKHYPAMMAYPGNSFKQKVHLWLLKQKLNILIS